MKAVETARVAMEEKIAEKVQVVKSKLEQKIVKEATKIKKIEEKAKEIEVKVVTHEKKFAEDEQDDIEIKIDPDTGKVMNP